MLVLMGRSWLFSDCTAALMFLRLALKSRAECQGRRTSHTRGAPAWLSRKQQVRPWGKERGKGVEERRFRDQSPQRAWKNVEVWSVSEQQTYWQYQWWRHQARTNKLRGQPILSLHYKMQMALIMMWQWQCVWYKTLHQRSRKVTQMAPGEWWSG